MKKILVTGGAGAVGSNLIERLVKDGHKVTSWDNYSAGKVENHIAGANYHPISTIQSVEALQDDYDLVYHLGEYSKVVPSFDEISNAFAYPSFINKSFKSLSNSNFLLISDSNKTL